MGGGGIYDLRFMICDLKAKITWYALPDPLIS